MPPFRNTMVLRTVLAGLLERPHDRHYGYDLSRSVGVRAGSLYPILGRLHEHGWVADGWEDAAEARGEGRPPRRYYTLTEHGRREAAELLDR